MKEQLDTIPAWSRLVFRWGSTVRYGNQQGSYNVRGVDPDQREIGQVSLTSGRFLSPRDLAQNRKVAVLGAQLVQDLFPKGTKPSDVVGEFIQLRGIQFAVVGTFNQAGSRWENRSVYVPFSTAQKLFQNDDVVGRVPLEQATQPSRIRGKRRQVCFFGSRTDWWCIQMMPRVYG